MRITGRTVWRAWVFLLLLTVGLSLFPTGSVSAAPATGFFTQVNGFSVQSSVSGGGANTNPSSGFTIAKLQSLPKLGGGRALGMFAVGSTNNPGDLGGAALFTPTAPTGPGTSNFPLYSEAFFPAEPSSGQSERSEKCGANPQSTPSDACREQPGPYAMAEVKPDENAPVSLGFARNGGRDGQGETQSTSEVKTDGEAVVSRQVNVGRQSGVPGTPIMVDNFRAESFIKTTREAQTATGSCTADVRVGTTAITTPEQLATVLALVAPAIKVTYTPPTKAMPKVLEAGERDGVEISCTGAKFEVTSGDVSTIYTYGSTFSTASPQLDSEAISLTGGDGSVVSDSGIVTTDPPATSGAPVDAGSGSPAVGTSDPGFTPSAPVVDPSASLPSVSTDSGGSASASFPDTGAALPSAPSPAAPSAAVPSAAIPPSAAVPVAAPAAAPAVVEAPATVPANQVSGGGDLVRKGINLARIAAGTTVAASLLPLGIWLLMGVVGSLARGTGLRLPPFRSLGVSGTGGATPEPI